MLLIKEKAGLLAIYYIDCILNSVLEDRNIGIKFVPNEALMKI